jgi:tetratricopeptide (TPR) repeat protein
VNDREHGNQNRVDGRAHNVVQGEYIYGGVHFYNSDGRLRVVSQVPPATRNFVNQVKPLTTADGALTAIRHGNGPHSTVFYGLSGSGRRAAMRVWVERHAALFPDGLFYADLSAGTEQVGLESEHLREFLLAAGYDPAAIPDTLAGRSACFRSWSATKRVLVALDNVLGEAQVKWLTPGAGPSVVMATSNRRLAGLGPKTDVTHVEIPLLDDDAARQLVAGWVDEERLRDEPEAVVSLLRFCGGLALALCVLGATIEASPRRRLADMVIELEDERRRLEALSMTEELSVKAVFKSAYDRLSPASQRCYKVLGLHPGTGDVGIGVLAGALRVPDDEARRSADELVRVSLIREVSRDRYLITGLVRVHAHDMAMAEDSEHDRVETLDRILAFYHDRVLIAGNASMPGRGWNGLLFGWPDFGAQTPEQVLGADPWRWFETEADNLRVCVEAAYRAQQFQRVCDLCVMLWPLHEQGKHLEDQIAANAMGLVAARHLGSLELEALTGIQQGFAYLHLGEADRASLVFSAALATARKTANLRLQATAVESLGLAFLAQGLTADALALLRENLQMAMSLGDSRRISLARFHLAKAEQPDVAVSLLRAALAGFVDPEVADPYNAAKSRSWLGRKLADLGLVEEAADTLGEALTEMMALGRPFDCLEILESLGDLARAEADTAVNLGNYQEALAIAGLFGLERETARLQGKISALPDGQSDRRPSASERD